MLTAHPLPQIGSWAQLMEDEEPPELQQKEQKEQEKSKDAKELGDNNVDLLDVDVRSFCVLVKNLPPKVSLEEIFFHFGGREKVKSIYFISKESSCLLVFKKPGFKKAAEEELDESYIFKEQIKVLAAHPQDAQKYYKQADPMPSPGFRANAPSFVPHTPQFSPTVLQMMSPPTASFYDLNPSGTGPTFESNQPAQHHLSSRAHQQHYERSFTNRHRMHVDRQRSTSDKHGSEYGRLSKQRYDGLAMSNPHSPALKTSSQSVAPTPTVKRPTNTDLYGAAKPVDTTEKLLKIENDDKLRLRQQSEAARKETQQMSMEETKTTTTNTVKSKSVLDDSHNDSVGNVDVNVASRSESKMDSAPKQNTHPASPIFFKDYGSVAIVTRNKPELTDSPAPSDPVQHPVAPVVEVVAKNESPRTRTFSRTTPHPSRSNSDIYKDCIVKHLGPQIESDRSRKESTKTEETREERGEGLNRWKPPLDKTSSRGPHGQSNAANRVTGQPGHSLKANQLKTCPLNKDLGRKDHRVENEKKTAEPKKMTVDDSKDPNKENNKKKPYKENKQSEPVTKKGSILDKNRFSALQGLENN